MKYNELKNNLLKKFPILIYLSGLKHPIKNIKTTLKINTKFKNLVNNPEDIEIRNIDIFRKSFIKLLWAQSKDADLPFLFLDAKIECIKENFDKNNMEKNVPILVCPVKNDIHRVQMSLDYYRSIGVKYFVYIDNLSTDGTQEYLQKQSDVNLYVCKTPYTTLNREAWINRILSYYGFERWYLCVDSDELFVYENMEEVSIEKYINSIDISKNRRIKSILLDMYSKEPIFKSDIPQEEIRNYYCYFDKNSYTQKFTYKLDLIKGGPRQRIFFKDGNSNTLTKYPLFFFKEGDIQCCSHFQFPFKYNCNLPCKTALLHYKFLKDDLEKYVERARKKNYSNGSIEYQKYIEAYEKGKDIIFYDNKYSIKFEDSTSLRKIEEIYNN